MKSDYISLAKLNHIFFSCTQAAFQFTYILINISKGTSSDNSPWPLAKQFGGGNSWLTTVKCNNKREITIEAGAINPSRAVFWNSEQQRTLGILFMWRRWTTSRYPAWVWLITRSAAAFSPEIYNFSSNFSNRCKILLFLQLTSIDTKLLSLKLHRAFRWFNLLIFYLCCWLYIVLSQFWICSNIIRIHNSSSVHKCITKTVSPISALISPQSWNSI